MTRSRALGPQAGHLPRILLFLPSLALLTGCFPHRAGIRLAGFAVTAPAPGSAAPPFTLTDLDGNPVVMNSWANDRPTVVQLGSYSCPVFRYRRFSMANIYRRYEGRVRFLVVYTQEAHPAGAESPYKPGREWNPWINRLTGVRILQPAALEARVAQAKSARERLKLLPPFLVDGMDNAAWKSFGSAPSPAFVFDRGGRVALQLVWVDPKPIAAALERLLEADDRQSAPAIR